MALIHTPVLVKYVLHYLITDLNGVYVDCTLGTGGHFQAISKKLNPNAVLIGLDVDSSSVDYCKQNIQIPQKSILVNSNYSEIKKVCFRNGYTKVNGVLIDLGISSFELNNPERGFTYREDGPLDMRFSPQTIESAEHFINTASISTMTKIFKEFGEEKYSGKIAKSIEEKRRTTPIKTTKDLANIISQTVSSSFTAKTLSRIFQAIRIHINKELTTLKNALPQMLEMLAENGRLVVISYHSLEDRIVKQFMKRESSDCICPPGFPTCKCNHKAQIEILTKKPIMPNVQEIKSNKRARSAKLRAAKKLRNDA
jgi:16S rRNA (cytosine1402-N4)-methyltransferase